MNRFILAAAALAIATPVLADQPQSVLEVRQHFAADDGGNEGKVFTGGTGITARSAAIHVANARQQDMVNSALVPTVQGLLSNEGRIVNDRAARIFMQIDAEDPTS